MIIDKIENAHLYFELKKELRLGLEYILKNDLKKIEVGSYELEHGVRAIFNAYHPKEKSEGVIESHKKYIDIQFVISGEEQIGYCPLQGQVPTEEYNEDKDVMFYKEELTYLKLQQGMFAIFFPGDIHQPGIQINKSSNVKKLVLKVPV